MGVGAQSAVAATRHRRAEEQAQDATHLVVECLHTVLTGKESVAVGVGEVVTVVGVAGARVETVGPRTKLHIKTVVHSLVGIMTTAPVRDDDAIEAPLPFEQVFEQVLVVTVVLVAIKIIGTHQSPGAALGDSSVEGGQVDLMEGAVADLDVDLMAVLFVVVEGEMLDTGCHTVALQPADIGDDHRGDQVRIFAHVFEVAAAERCAQNVHAGSEDHVLAPIAGFLAKAAAVVPRQRGVPGGSQTGQRREGHTRVVGLSGLFPFVPEHVGTHTVRAVVGPEIGKAQARNTARGELALCMEDIDLLLQGHPAHGVVDAALDGLAVIEVKGLLRRDKKWQRKQEDGKKDFAHR